MPVRRVLPLVGLALAGCGGSGSDDGGEPPDRASYLIGGGGCFDEPVEGDVPGEATGSCQLLSLGADLPSSGLLPTGSGLLMFDGREYELDSAIRVRSTSPEQSALLGVIDEQLLLHDGETRVLTSFEGEPSLPGGPVDELEYGVFDASLALSLTLLRPPSQADPSGRVYELALDAGNDGGRGDVSTGIVESALFVVDLDGDLVVSSREEIANPTSGQIVWSGTEEFPSLTFNFVLEDGRSIEGAYEGGYERTEPLVGTETLPD